MNARVNKVLGLWRGADGSLAEVVYDGSQLCGLDAWKAVKALCEPRNNYGTAIELENGQRIILPTNDIGRILPDATGVLVLFDSEKSEYKNFIRFLPPNNAAIFNSDGSLRFCLKNPYGKYGVFRAITNTVSFDGRQALGVRACPMDWPVCEWVYMINGSTDDLSTQVPRWVRD